MVYTGVMERRYIESFVFLALLLGTLALVVFMALPYLSMLVLAAVLAFLLSGAYEWLARIIHRRALAAFIMTIAVLIVILVPLSFVGYQLAQEATSLYTTLNSKASGQHIGALLEKLQEATRSYIPAAQVDAQAVSERLQQVLSWLIGHLGVVFTGITSVALSFSFFLLFFYYLLRDGARLKERIMELSPLSNRHEQQIIDRVTTAISGTLRGQVILSLFQGVVAGFGFLFFGVPNPVLWGSVAALASFIPLVGTSLVFIPVILYLAITGPWQLAVGMTLWGAIAVGMLDNVLGPKLMSQGTKLHPLIMMIAVLGGIGMFGPIGILIGPILTSTLFALFDIYLSLLRPGASGIAGRS